jgi:antitoxin MazE
LRKWNILCISNRMRTSVQKWGNSLGIRIPKLVAEETALRPGSMVELEHEGDVIVLRPIRRRKPRYRLADLVRRITPHNRPDEVSEGRPRGREVW